MERTLRHAITYTNTGRVPVAAVAASLLANERLLREAAYTLQDLMPGLEVTELDVVFRRASSDSPLREAMEAVINVVFQDDLDDLDERIPDALRILLGVDIPERFDGLITVIVIAIATYGVFWALDKIGKKDTPEGRAVLGNYNQIISAGRDIIMVDDDRFSAAVEKRFEKSKGQTLARNSLEMIRPAQAEPGAAVEGGGVRIEPETVQAAPQSTAPDTTDDPESQDYYTSQRIVIHATDIDSQKTGWAGHLPGVWEKRLPMRLFPSVDPRTLFAQAEVTGDVMVVSRRNAAGDYVPYVFHVIGID